MGTSPTASRTQSGTTLADPDLTVERSASTAAPSCTSRGLQLTLFDGVCRVCREPVQWIYPVWTSPVVCNLCLPYWTPSGLPR